MMTTDLFGSRHDAGGAHRWALQPGVRGSAEFSPCGRYRYWLRRDWGEDGAPFALFVAMNPSTATPNQDDPTIRKEQGYTRRAGLTSLIKCNIADYRSTDPKQLLRENILPRSDENLRVIKRFAAEAAMIVVCWGALPNPLRGYAQSTAAALSGYRLLCLGVTADGSPRHPLYVPNDAPLMPWSPPRNGLLEGR